MPLEIKDTLDSKNRITKSILKDQNLYSKFVIENNVTNQTLAEKDIYINYLNSFSLINYEDSISLLNLTT